MSPKKWPPFYFLSNSNKNKPMWIMFGTQNPEEILHKCFWICPPHLKNVTTAPSVLQKISFSTATALRAWNCIYFFTNEKYLLQLPCELTNLPNIHQSGNQKAWHVTHSYACIPFHFQQLHNGQCSGQFDLLVVKITRGIHQHSRWLVLTTAVMLLV